MTVHDLDAARWDDTRRPSGPPCRRSGRLIVACTDPRCPWRETVRVWPIGYAQAALTVKELLAQHLTSGECEWTS
jgi:hypothetical protein